jgi:hypothetical protein
VRGEFEEKPLTRFVGLRTATSNLGDHIQLLAADRLLRRAGVEVEFRIDRDDEVAASQALDELSSPAGILLNGWFKTNPAQWPPHRNLIPMYLGFHVRLFQAPSLVAEPALENYAKFGPVGCRDNYTMSLLAQHGSEVFLSNCLSLLNPRRLEDPETQTEIFVVSRDERIREYVPFAVGEYEYINQYSNTDDFDDNLSSAINLLDKYKNRARLIITSMLHCALPAIAMGIPVVVFYPLAQPEQHQSDRERFSTLERMIRVYHMSEAHRVDWAGRSVDVSEWKFDLLEAFLRLAGRWTLPAAPSPPRRRSQFPTQSGRPSSSWIVSGCCN